MSEAAPQTPNTKRLSKMPIIIASTVVTILVAIVLYSLSEQSAAQQKKQEEPSNLSTAQESESDYSMQKVLSQKDRRPSTSEYEPPKAPQEVETVIGNQQLKPSLQSGVPQNPRADFDNRPRAIAPIDTKLAVKEDQRFAMYDNMRTENFKRAILSTSKKTFDNNSTQSPVTPPPSPNSSYEEKMNYYSQLQARLAQQTSGDSTAQYQARLALAKQMIGDIQGNNTTQQPSTVTAQNTKEGSRDWQLHSSLENAKSFTINTGFVIPAVMVTGINSDLAGSIIGQVSQNVYDTATGKHLLIPQGTKLFGTYSSQIQYGQERVLVAWNRLIYPDGSTMDLGQMIGADVGGYSGFSDQVNNHYWKLFKGAFLLSMITAAVTYSDNKYNTGDGESRSATSAMSESLGQNLGDVSTELIRKNMNVSPTLEIRNGYRFNVVVTKDISFGAPYKFQE